MGLINKCLDFIVERSYNYKDSLPTLINYTMNSSPGGPGEILAPRKHLYVMYLWERRAGHGLDLGVSE